METAHNTNQRKTNLDIPMKTIAKLGQTIHEDIYLIRFIKPNSTNRHFPNRPTDSRLSLTLNLSPAIFITICTADYANYTFKRKRNIRYPFPLSLRSTPQRGITYRTEESIV